mmetsp:Transcript_38322/g.90081  ORF Transcript_38322/g.90081 Transcript_38322/m.90081 type:complete len:89 (-) Transcript_38322:23-289(-)
MRAERVLQQLRSRGQLQELVPQVLIAQVALRCLKKEYNGFSKTLSVKKMLLGTGRALALFLRSTQKTVAKGRQVLANVLDKGNAGSTP